MTKLKWMVAAVVAAAVGAGPVAAANPGKSGTRAGHKLAGQYMPRSERGRLAGVIVRSWAGYVHRVYGTSPGVWARAMAATFAQADIANLRRAARMKTYEGMTATLLGQKTSDAEIIDKLAKSDGSLSAVMALGSPSEDLVYTMITPCRIVDTRVAGGPLQAGVARNFIGHTATNFDAQGGAHGDCGIPANPSALALNITVVRPAGTAYGNLTAYPYGVGKPLASSLNFLGGTIVGNEVIVKQAIGEPFNFRLHSNATTHVVVDVAGYFMAPVATALDCVDATVAFDIPANSLAGTFATCPSGYSVTGGGCNTVLSSARVSESYTEASFNDAFCEVFNPEASATTATAIASCCRVPGR